MNVKTNFLDWFVKNANYKTLPQSTILKYIEGYVAFLGFDPFEISDDFSGLEEVKERILNKTVELRENKDYLDFQYKSSRNAPEAFLGKKNYFVFLDELKNNNKPDMLNLSSILTQPEIQKIIQEHLFFFQKGQDALNRWLGISLSEDIKNTLINLSKDYHAIQEESTRNEDIKQILDLLFEITSYCDNHAKDKTLLNKYDDKRALADAGVRMNTWIEKLIQFKFSHNNVEKGSTLNAFNYLLDPENNSTILSEEHREFISLNLIKKPYNALDFVDDLKSFFSPYDLKVNNSLNYTHLLMHIVYAFQNIWKEEIIGLMASDSTGWQDVHIQKMKDFDSVILWNSKKPSGTTLTLKSLENLIKKASSFNLYYSSNGKVTHKARIIDFATSQKELDNKRWTSNHKIYGFEELFDKYVDGKKSAHILFLADSFEKINPIPVSEFSFYKGFSAPRQDNLTPIKQEPEQLYPLKLQQVNPSTKNPKYPTNQILYGPPGTGKTYNTINRALEILGEPIEGKTRTEIKGLFNNKLNEGQIVFTTFHQSMSYEDFVEGIKPLKPEANATPIKYDIIPGIFKKLCRSAATPQNISFDISYKKLLADLEEKGEIELKAKNVSYKILPSENGEDLRVESNTYIKNITKEGLEYVSRSHKYAGVWGQYYKALFQYLNDNYGYNESEKTDLKNHVLIIDEINRGNISQIFGELITLIEEDKRLGKEEELLVTLPYSKEKFGVPSNVYIIGTMNTADRSVEALDTALRRRFSFEEIPPNYDLINYEIHGIKGSALLQTLNKRIEKLLDKDHLIGHSYFMIKNGDNAEEKLLTAFYKNIIPLLQEYFFGDFGKIGLVLGNGFVHKKEWDKNSDSFAEFDYESVGEFEDRPVYEIIDHRLKDQKEGSFANAILTLMNKKVE